MPASGLDRLLPQKEVAPEDQPPHMCAGQNSRRLLPHLAGSQGWIKNDWHDCVTGFHRIPASVANGSEDGKCGPEQPVANRCGELGGQLPQQITSGQSGGHQDTAWAQRSGATADIKYPITWAWQVPQEQAVVIGVVIPVHRVHALRLWWTACPLRARLSGKPPAITVTRGQEPAPITWADAGHSLCRLRVILHDRRGGGLRDRHDEPRC